MAELTYAINSRHRATITLRGDVVHGDAERFEALAKDVSEKHLDPEIRSITAALDSPGGDYIEGLRLGNLFWRSGYRTLVKASADCYSAAAFAFLGGTFFHAVGGWSPDRSVEAGASIGFHGFYSDSTETVSLGEGIEHGKTLSMILSDYANTMQVNPQFIVESLKKGPSELLLLSTVEHFRDLGVAVFGTTPALTLTDERAVTAANYATGWKRPVALQPIAGETLAIVAHLSTADYRRKILRHAVEQAQPEGPIASIVRQAAQRDADGDAAVETVYRDAEQLNIVPRLWLRDTDRVIHVRGFDYGGGFYTSDCYVKPSNEGSPNLGVQVVRVNFRSYFELFNYTRRGDILYEVLSPQTVLWLPESDSG